MYMSATDTPISPTILQYIAHLALADRIRAWISSFKVIDFVGRVVQCFSLEVLGRSRP